MKLKLKDKVTVISGKDKGQTSEIEKVYPKSGKVTVKGLNVYKKHVKKSESFPQGGVVPLSRPLHAGKVMLVCPHCKEKTRIGYTTDSKGRKFRMCRKCKQTLN